MTDDIKRYEQAMLWRSQALPFMRLSLEQLYRARDACPMTGPTMERRKIEQAIKLARAALKECENNLVVARRMVDRQTKGA